MKAVSEKYYALIPVLLFCSFYIYKAIHHPVHDFANYYFGGYFLMHGHFTSDIYFPYWFNTQIVALGNPSSFAGLAPNTPFLALLLVPFTFMTLAAAKLAFNCLSVLLFLYSLARLVLFCNIKPVSILFIPLLFLVPIRNELLFGQVYLLLFFFLSESWLASEKNQPVKSGIFLSLAILLKVFPVLLILLLLFKRQYKVVVSAAVSSLVLIGVTMIFSGFDIWIFYIKNVLPKASNGGIASAYVTNYQSAFMFLKQLLVFDATENPGALLNNPLLFSALMVGFKIALVAVGFYVTRKVTNSLLVFSYWILAAILMSPYGSTYTFILMLFPFVAVVKSGISNSRKTAFLGLLVVANNLPLSLFMDCVFPLSYLRLCCLLLLFILLLSIACKTIHWKMVAAVSLVPMILLILFGKPNLTASAYFLPKNSPLLIYDYKIANNRLTYFYWNQNGKNSKTIPLKSSDITLLNLKGNKIYYYNRPLISDTGNKLKPVLIDNRTILYLSDCDRGIGFYTLRKIDIR